MIKIVAMEGETKSKTVAKENKTWSHPGLPGSTGFHRAKSPAVFYLDPARPQARVGWVSGRPVGPGFKTMLPVKENVIPPCCWMSHDFLFLPIWHL